MPKKSFLDLLAHRSQKTSPSKVDFTANSKKETEAMKESEPLEAKEWLAETPEEGQLTLDVYQTDKDIIIKSTIAGVDPSDLDISYNNGMLTIKGERKQEEKITKEDYFYQELYWGSFSRSVILPTDIDPDGIDAELKNGILTVRLPKKEAQNQKKIKVKAI